MFDYHMHTYHSADCRAEPGQMAEAAVAKGLTEICFTDHVDYDYPDPAFVFDFDKTAYRNEIEVLSERFKGVCKVKRGVEIGVQPHLLGQYEQLVQEEQFDFIICSVHTVRRSDLHSRAIFGELGAEDAFEAYYSDLYKCVKEFSAYSVLGHADLIKRYADRVPNADYRGILQDIFKTIVPKGKGIEINTSGTRYGLPSAMPSPDILKLYKQCGGEVLTIGSDAHRPEDVGYEVKKSLELARDIGFRYVAAFQAGEPEFHPISRLLG
ncbi:histidinol-phosphatase HisJ family protein [Sporosarcina trichiuri]|uniref:histidinol-phosphatase HisJ family protein n=1 Tax=Sporosarcina trichiuri TaxID=3056445 RepID=UPI0025B39AB9|nr:histidinol-phosphatase HisJ family protein [Sporosarcina sp. 0.2-SM1T-5]WJY27885.1 histidinol-phosphatase HisJ family protein [Sporosarcina sp. 0.2-SM1T-5]